MPRHFPWGANDPNTVCAAISAYQHAVCARVECPMDAVCWFNQMNYEVAPGLRISHSAGVCLLGALVLFSWTEG